jgi:uncharacterized FlaG/YvyC family protein
MATIQNLGAAYSVHLARKDRAPERLPAQKRTEGAKAESIPMARIAIASGHTEEAQFSRDSSEGGRAIENAKEQFKRMSLDELAEMLRKVNLTFDVFEIQARYTIDRESGDISIEVINQRTGEVIRKIPPYDIPDFADAILFGSGMVTDVMA